MAIDSEYIKQQAKMLAEYEIHRGLAQIQRNEQRYKQQLEAVGKLDSALKALNSAIKALRGTDASMLINTALFSKEGYATASLGSKAAEGSYAFFVEQLASRHQLAVDSRSFETGVEVLNRVRGMQQGLLKLGES